MIVAPIARGIEVTGPDAQAVATGGRLLDPVSSRGDGKSFGHHGRTEIATGNQAGGQQATIAVHVFRAAIGGTGGKQLRHAVASRPAATPALAIGASAILRQLRRVQAQQPDAVLTKAETVAIAGAAEPGDWRWRLIEGGSDHGRRGEHSDRQERTGRATKETVTMVESMKDFTTR